jgi:hypothetical protein
MGRRRRLRKNGGGELEVNNQDVVASDEKDEDLQGMIRSTRCVYARQLKTAWDVKYWYRESNKTSQTKQLADVLDFHESRMIHGR